mgnify:CR=1 FL=1
MRKLASEIKIEEIKLPKNIQKLVYRVDGQVFVIESSILSGTV